MGGSIGKFRLPPRSRSPACVNALCACAARLTPPAGGGKTRSQASAWDTVSHCTLHPAVANSSRAASSLLFVESVNTVKNTPRVQVLAAKRVLESLPPLPFQRFSFLLDLCIANG